MTMSDCDWLVKMRWTEGQVADRLISQVTAATHVVGGTEHSRLAEHC